MSHRPRRKGQYEDLKLASSAGEGEEVVLLARCRWIRGSVGGSLRGVELRLRASAHFSAAMRFEWNGKEKSIVRPTLLFLYEVIFKDLFIYLFKKIQLNLNLSTLSKILFINLINII